MLLLVALVFFMATLLAIRVQPRWFVHRGLDAASVGGKFSGADWQPDGSLRITGFGLGDYLRTDYIELNFSWIDLIRNHHFRGIDIHGGQVWVSKIPKGGHLVGATDRLRIYNGTLLLDNLGPDMPIIPIRMGSSTPVVLNDIALGGQQTSADLNKKQTLTIENISITSPCDALAPVLDLKAVNITFTWAEILNNKIEKLQVLSPKIYIGPDLFWFTDEFRKQSAASVAMSKPWSIDQVEIQGGQIAISAFGQPGVTLPFYFMSEGQAARIDRLSEIPLNVKIVIPQQDHSYPDYKVELKHLRGEIAFALPLSEHNADNVVPTVYFDEVSWNQLAVTKAWSSLTFDRTGIYGKMGGECYKGYLNSEFSILFQPDFPWRGTFSMTKVGAKSIAERIAINYVSLEGTLNGQMQVEGKSRVVGHSTASLKLENSGRMEIKSLDKLLSRIPPTWSVTQQDAAKILIDALRTYDYTEGELTMDYQLPDSEAKLSLRGAQGPRTLNLHWHQEPADAADAGASSNE